MKFTIKILSLCIVLCGCSIKNKSITLTEIDIINNNSPINYLNQIKSIDTTCIWPVINLKLNHNNTMEFISNDECSYKYLQFIESLNVYELKYIEYNYEGTILVSKMNGKNLYFDGEIIFNEDYSHFISYSDRINDMPSTVKLYSINPSFEINLLYTFKTLLRDPIGVNFENNNTAIIYLSRDSVLNKYILEF